MTDQPTESAQETSPADAHLAEVEAGCGCVEVWEYLSERREASDGGSGVPVSETNGGSSDQRSDGDAASREAGD